MANLPASSRLIALFLPGEVAITSGFVNSFGSQDIAESVAIKLVDRHISGDFGVICGDDVIANQKAIANRGLIFSKYEVGTANEKTVKVYVITDPGHSGTTVLLPSEY